MGHGPRLGFWPLLGVPSIESVPLLSHSSTWPLGQGPQPLSLLPLIQWGVISMWGSW